MSTLSGKTPVNRPRRRSVDYIEHCARDLGLVELGRNGPQIGRDGWLGS